jgi:hypothetical protein
VCVCVCVCVIRRSDNHASLIIQHYRCRG